MPAEDFVPVNAAQAVSSHLTRRDFLAAAAVAAATLRGAGAFAEDVSWLDEIQRAPADFPARALALVLVDEAGQPITTLAQWQPARERLRRRWLDFLGPMPAERPAIRLEVLSEERLDGVVRQLVRYESEAVLPVEAYLLRPENSVRGRDAHGRRAGVVALHPTTNDTIDEIAGVRGRDGRDTGLQLARQGFVVVCPRCFLWQNASSIDEAVEAFRRRHPETLGMHKMLWDAQRALDVLCSLSDTVDKSRLGAIGHSLGAKEALYLAAFDDRLTAAVASEGGIGLPHTNWHALWYLGGSIRDADFPREHHELLALAAPKPFLIIAGESGPGAADGDRTWPYVAAALPVYRLYGKPARLGIYNHHEGHSFSQKTFDRCAEWLLVYLGLK